MNDFNEEPTQVQDSVSEVVEPPTMESPSTNVAVPEQVAAASSDWHRFWRDAYANLSPRAKRFVQHWLMWPARMSVPLFVLSASLTACLLVLFFFCPRFVVWKSIDYPFGWFNPDVNRAVATWNKVQEPYVWMRENAPINWRLFFPVIAHYTGISRTAFLTIPFVGCWLALGTICHLTLRETGSRKYAFMLTTLCGTTSWYFVSTGWLAYFDSWYILGMIVACFYRSYWSFAAACLLVPWIDERFALMMPTIFAVRAAYFHWIPNRDWRAFATCSLIVLVTTVPYLAARVVAVIYELDPVAKDHIAEHMGSRWTDRLGSGIWNGFRGAWILFLFCLAAITFRYRWWWSTAFIVVCCANVGMLVRIVTGDHSRTVSVGLPLIILGAFLLKQMAPMRARTILFGLLLFNLLAPAEHIVTTFNTPIRYFYSEYDRFGDPPIFLRAESYTHRGIKFYEDRKYKEALEEFDIALSLDPEFHTARLNKGIIFTFVKRYDEAIVELDRVIAATQEHPEAFYARGICREQRNDFKGAIADFDQALQSPKKEWGFRNEAQRLYDRLYKVGFRPPERPKP